MVNPALPLVLSAGMGLSALGLLALGSRPARAAGAPTLGWVKAELRRLRIPLPRPGQRYLVVTIRRTTPVIALSTTPGIRDPFNDWIGILANHGGRLAYRHARGTGEPGFLPMWGKGKLATAPEGVSRLYAPQFAPNAYGGGFHHHRTSHPAFRQVGAVRVQLFKRERARWTGPIRSPRSHHNIHTTSRNTDPARTAARGVRDYSHGCPVVLDPAQLDRLRAFGGWTPEIDGTRLSLVTLLWPTCRAAPSTAMLG